jgi:soluble lytic murein transglycosylase
VRRSDREDRDADGHLRRLAADEHHRRATIYLSNRAFAEAREHWEALFKYYPHDQHVPAAFFGIGRSYFQERRYGDAFSSYAIVAQNYPDTKEGREGLYFSAAASLRLGQPRVAVDRYREYIEEYPTGERFDAAHLNLIDTLREAGQPKEAIQWIERTRQRFADTPTETNALFARLRLDVAEGNWKHAITTAEELSKKSFPKSVLTSAAEVTYLKAYSLEQLGRKEEAFTAYLSIGDSINSYYGGLATERLLSLADGSRRSLVQRRVAAVNAQIASAATTYPVPYRQVIVRVASMKKIDARFVLAIIRQESVFVPQAKSPSGARGLLQLTIDAAKKYAAGAGMKTLSEDQLYRPETSILLGGEYLAALNEMFPHLPEAVAASYNGGEDNVARWVKRAKQKDAGVFTAEIGFEETKAYVQKVMANYRAYQKLYTAQLVRR